mmetsp:Transcript_3570/g.6333  ORF Transcript_3570/g.6333 Transcript_3570/m.6333 type:complete len:390 (-) Transcript_3570:162-1331(-)
MAQGPLWILGVFLEILSTLSGTAGKQLIRLSELLSKKAPATSKTVFHVGLLINTIAGPILDMAAYSFAAQSLIAPFGGLDVVWNAALAPYFLKETLTRSRLVACGMIFAGTLMSSAFASHHEEKYTIEMLEEKLVDARVLIYLACLALFVAFNILVPMKREKGDLLRGVSLGVTAGVIAGNMFCVKAAVELIETSIWEQRGEIWLHWMPYAVLVGAAFFALSNVVFMTKGLLEFEALFMVTIYEGSMIVSNCISASIVLLELEGLEWWRVLFWCICVVTVCLGMFLMSREEAKVRKEKEENPLGPEAATVVGGKDGKGADEETPLPASADVPDALSSATTEEGPTRGTTEQSEQKDPSDSAAVDAREVKLETKKETRASKCLSWVAPCL